MNSPLPLPSSAQSLTSDGDLLLLRDFGRRRLSRNRWRPLHRRLHLPLRHCLLPPLRRPLCRRRRLLLPSIGSGEGRDAGSQGAAFDGAASNIAASDGAASNGAASVTATSSAGAAAAVAASR